MTNSKESINPLVFQMLCGEHLKDLPTGEPMDGSSSQDAFSFLVELLHKLDAELGPEHNIMAPFEGQYLNRRICKDCGKEDEWAQPQTVLELELKGRAPVDLKDCIATFFHEDRPHTCEGCKSHNVHASKEIAVAPEILMVQVNRKLMDDDGVTVKLMNEIRLDTGIMDFSKYSTTSNQEASYHLQAAILHHGKQL